MAALFADCEAVTFFAECNLFARKFQSFAQRALAGMVTFGQLDEPLILGIGFAAHPSGLVAVE